MHVQESADIINKLDKQNQSEFTPDTISALKTLWQSPSVQSAFERRNEYQLNDSTK
jgi:hypothetical protein